MFSILLITQRRGNHRVLGKLRFVGGILLIKERGMAAIVTSRNVSE